MQRLTVNLPPHSYDILLERGGLARLGNYVNLKRKVMLVTDSGVPEIYAQTVLAQCQEGYKYVAPAGEEAKSMATFESICGHMLEWDFTRTDCVVALGGGVVGDVAGFAAACYMRGVDFINLPTTSLAQIDSGIGGKVAINLNGVKNIIGAFYQPRLVMIDYDVLQTLNKRHLHNGLVEAVKAGLIYDPRLFELFESDDFYRHLDEIIQRALLVKKQVVEQDEKEEHLRKILNFGHTLGHGLESFFKLSQYLHGECVALGMLPMLEDQALKERVLKVFKRLNLPLQVDYDREAVYQLMNRDKKKQGDSITIVKVPALGEYRLDSVKTSQLRDYLTGD